jgi:hypothetical protein
MFALIIEADLVVCDVTVHNANVFYELGIRHALRKKRTVLIKGGPTNDGTPFDLLTDRYMAYEVINPGASRETLSRTIEGAVKSTRSTDSPVFQMLPTLVEADVANINIVPVDFRQDVNRAKVEGSKGWLRLLADEVRSQRFQWEGLKLVGRAQWDLKDYDGACQSWEIVREMYPDDVGANLALANIYERLSRAETKPELITLSVEALDRVLNNILTTGRQRVEALTLRGRNLKTSWRLEFEQLNAAEKRAAAMNRGLMNSYEAYLNAFLEDLNHYYSGIAALQMGTILLDLSKEDVWYGPFRNDSEAKAYQAKVAEQAAFLRSVVPGSIEAALRKLNQMDSDRVWAEVSRADVLFMTDSTRIEQVVSAYRDAIPKDKLFAWDAARGQLKLFADLGIKSALANAVIAANDKRFQDTKKAEETSSKKPVHVIISVGHRIDAPTRLRPRFPADREPRARTLIREAIQQLRDEKYDLHLLASAAPGADILTHEICQELDLASTICLPMPKEDFGSFAFEALDGWRTRFLNLASSRKVLELSDRKGLPRWLQGSKVNPWERGNRWVMQMALAYGADRITLLALWDGNEAGDDFGGTAHMVQLARGAGHIRIERIEAKELLTEIIANAAVI